MPYTIARAIMDDSIGFDTYTDALAKDPTAQQLARRITMYVHDGIENTWKGGSRPVNVRIHLRDGRVLERQVDISKGNPEVALTPAELKVKFDDCARLSLGALDTAAAAKLLQTLETLPSLDVLTGHLAGRQP
jgi:2-methylcitrate dehydratase PrpD